MPTIFTSTRKPMSFRKSLLNLSCFSRKKLLLAFTFSFAFFQGLLAQNFNLQFRSEVSYPYTCASIWGYVQNDSEYALVGTSAGVSIVNVTHPDNPVVLFNVTHTTSEWREIKTYSHYAYATNENGNGLLIIDLQYLPDSVKKYQFVYTPSVGPALTTGHTLWIDENGRLFVFGANGSTSPYSGYACFDLTSDPLNPTFLGSRASPYIHDGFIRGDTLWASEIYIGQLQVINVADPANPVPLVQFSTPSSFTHNSWPTHDDHYLFTTDEVNNSYLASYDVSDFGNITELDKAQSNPGSDVIIHNVHLYNDQFAVVAYYKDGVVLFDVSHPDNMIECGSYDTDPGESGGDYGGTWGVYPYLPSGNIIASDLTDAGAGGGKLTVLTPSYVAACWLQGTITDSMTGASINNAYVEVETTPNTDFSDLSGVYKTGNGVPGTYTVRYSKLGYVTKEVDVVLSTGVETNLDIQLAPLPSFAISGQVIDSVSGIPIQDATVFFSSPEGFLFTATTDANGNFTFNGYQSTYDIYVGKWGHHETGLIGVVINPNPLPFLFKLHKGYYDDYLLNFGWTESHTSTTGFWTRGEPIGTYDYNTPINPEYDLPGDWGDQCYVTGNGGGGIGYDDVDNGSTTLTSPVMDLSSYGDAVVKFYAWFANVGGVGNPNDTLDVYLTNGTSTWLVMQITKDNFPPSQWNYHEFHVNSYGVPNGNMRVKFKAVDADPGHVTEAGLDHFMVDDAFGTNVSVIPNDGGGFSAYPNPFIDQETISYQFAQLNGKALIEIHDVLGNKLEALPVNTSSGTLSFGKNLPAGVYFIHIVEDERTVGVMKVVKVKK